MDIQIKRADFIRLAETLIENNHPEIIEKYSEKLNQVDSNPEFIFDDDEYYYDTQNRKFQAYRGGMGLIKENIEWFLLIDTLQFNKVLWELDWKTPKEEANSVLKNLSDFKRYEMVDINGIHLQNNEGVEEYFRMINNKIDTNNLVIINLDIDSDSYVTGIIKTENLEILIELAKKYNCRISKY